MSVTLEDLERARSRRLSPYASSHQLEELDVELPDGTQLALVLKSEAVAEHARGAKPEFLVDPGREQRVYEELLPAVGEAAPRLYGALDGGLLLERIDGAPLTEIGERETWERVARQIADIHERLPGPGAVPLVRYDPTFYGRWIERASAFAGEAVRLLEIPHARAVGRLLALPEAVIHGELYASNVIVGGDRICVVDWETAALGPDVVDVAALTSGSWSDSERERLALAYLDARDSSGRAESEFLDDVMCARLHLAVQWLGWSASWQPPPEQAQDWLAEATDAAERIP